jgi:hypothetical protein
MLNEVQTLARYCDRFLEAQIIPALEKAETKFEQTHLKGANPPIEEYPTPES